MSVFLETGLRDREKVISLTDVMKPSHVFDWLSDLGAELPTGLMSNASRVVHAESPAKE